MTMSRSGAMPSSRIPSTSPVNPSGAVPELTPVTVSPVTGSPLATRTGTACGAVARGLGGLRRCRHDGGCAEAQAHRGGE